MRKDYTSDPLERFKSLMPRSNDLTLVVLKGHLLMEEQIDELLLSLLPNPRALANVKFSIPTRISLVRALLPPRAFADRLDQAEKLNTLRNRLAHNLEPPQIENQIKQFVRAMENAEDWKALEAQSIARRLKRCLGFICGSFSGFAASAKIVRQQSGKPLQHALL